MHKETKKMLGIESLRGFAALWVVCYHLTITFRKEKYFNTELFAGFFNEGFRGVDVFFVLSGFVIAMVARRETTWDFLKARCIRIYPTYWLASIPLFFACAFGNACSGTTMPDLTLFVQTVFLLPRANVESYVPVVAWSLVHELLFYCLVMLSRLVRLDALKMTAVWALLCIVYHLARESTSPSYPLSFLFDLRNAYFFIGVLAFRLHEHAQDGSLHAVFSLRNRGLRLGLLGLLFALLLLAGRLNGSYWTYEQHNLASYVYFGSLSGLLIVFLANVADANRVVVWLGSISYALYLLHYPILVTGTRLALKYKLVGLLPLELIFLVLVGVCVAIAGLVDRFFDVPVRNYLRRISGGRQYRKNLQNT